MKRVAKGISEWSWFSEEKQLCFNGHLLEVGEHRILVDPPPLTHGEVAQIRAGGQVDYVLLTNRDHLRETHAMQKEFGCQVYVPEGDANEMDLVPTKTFADGELLPGGIWVVHLTDQKSPGECAFFLQQGPGIMIVGDALIGKPQGRVSMLAEEKYANREKAREGLRRLLKYNFDMLLVGDGASIFSGAKQIVTEVLQ